MSPRNSPVDARRAYAPRRALRRDEAATYVGISPSKFDELVKDGRMPKPKNIDARKVWDIRQLDLVLNELFDDSGPNELDAS